MDIKTVVHMGASCQYSSWQYPSIPFHPPHPNACSPRFACKKEQSLLQDPKGFGGKYPYFGPRICRTIASNSACTLLPMVGGSEPGSPIRPDPAGAGPAAPKAPTALGAIPARGEVAGRVTSEDLGMLSVPWRPSELGIEVGYPTALGALATAGF